MTGDVTSTLENLPPATTSSPAHSTSVVPVRARTSPDAQPQILVPAGIFGDILGSLAGTIGETAGGFFGNKELGRTLGTAAGPLIKHFSPFEVYAPSVAPQSAGPETAASEGPAEAVVVVPAGFITGLLGGIGGKLLGGAVGGLLGNKDLGSSIGSGVGGALGSFFGPFDVVPPSLVPASAGPAGVGSSDEALVVVPAGFFGNLLGATAGAIGNLIGGQRGQQIGDIAGGLAKQLLPWSVLPPEVSPQSTGPDGQQKPDEQLVVVPASFFSGILKNYGDLISCFPTLPSSLFNAHKPSEAELKNATDIAPFHTVPPALVPASADGSTPAPEDTLMFVPAGLFGGLLSSLGGTLGGAIGGIFGHSQTGSAIGNIAGQLGNLLPFSVVPR